MPITQFTLALGLALSCTALGATVNLRLLLTANPHTTGQLGYDGGTFLVSQFTGEGRDLLMGKCCEKQHRPCSEGLSA